MTNHLLCLGFGYSARQFAAGCLHQGWKVSGTTRAPERLSAIAEAGVEPLLFDGVASSTDVSNALKTATHVVVSIAPGANGDPTLTHFAEDLRQNRETIRWIAYLSTVGVYGDHGGAWVDEATPIKPTSERSKYRAAAELAWLSTCGDLEIPLQVLRLSGIYGPGRSPLDRLRNGTARRLIKPGQVFNRIHVADIANALTAGMNALHETGIFNVTDDLPAPPQDVIEYAAGLAALPVPPDIPFETADLSPMARSFYSENKRVSNQHMKQRLGVRLDYPTYREGLAAIAAATR